MKEAMSLRCSHCGRTPSSGDGVFGGCPHCHGALFLQVPDDAVREVYAGITGLSRGSISALAGVSASEAVCLGEGLTPLIDITDKVPRTGCEQVWLKNEATNPTGSYKDRLNAVAVSVARKLGFANIACSSTGNHGVSMAAYAAAGQMRALVLLPKESPRRAREEIERMGGIAMVGAWDERGAALNELVMRRGWAYSGRNWPRPLANPHGIEGYKLIAYEIVSQLGGDIPDWVVMPACGGDGIYGVWRGFKELHRVGITGACPAMLGCQAQKSPSLMIAWEENSDELPEVPLEISVALSLTDRRGGLHGLWAIRESFGRVTALREEQFVSAMVALGRIGVLAEPAGAAGLAGLMKASREHNDLFAGKTAVVVMTGGAGRWSQTFEGLPGGIPYSSGRDLP